MSEKWQHKQLGQLLKLRGGYAFKSEDFREHGDVAVLRISNIKNNGIDLEDAVYVDRNVAEQAKDYKLREGNVVIAMSGATTGKTAIVRKEDLPLVLNQRVGVFDIYNSEHLSEEYLAYVVQSSSFKNQILVNAIGGAQPNISGKQIEDVEILLPPLNEQRKIAAILSSVDEAIEKTEAIIEQTEKVKKGLMQQLLTKGIGHTKFKKTEIGEIPEEWEVRRLEEICEIRYGKSPKGVKVEYSDYPIMGTSGHVGYAKEFLFSGPMILVGRKGTIDKPIYIERDCWIIDTAYGLFADQTKVSLKWLYYFLTSYDLASLNEATGVPSLNRNSLYSIKVPLPSLNEQNKISNILTSIEQKIETEKEKLSIINEIKKGLMQSLLTGKVRVKVDDEVVSS
ncbi:restriction endonuclease subunit S [Geobacillus jurassicus]|uniref:Restriction endonuclease subunit S n=1 Tax=Geobacillus jurassicus TaxID=235932 RepID=A0ABV6GVD6_9BACL|nr:restriction endonuclease subunit S [Geobacillus jurassicus]